MKKITVLLYHRVCELTEDVSMLAVSPGNFDAHMKYISENYKLLRLSDDFEKFLKTSDKDGIIVTFDDGYYDWEEYVLPILKKYNVPATMFITTGYVDTDREYWTENLHRALFSYKTFQNEYSINDEYLSCCWDTSSYEKRCALYKVLRKIFQTASNSRREKLERDILAWAGLSEYGRANRKAISSEQIKVLGKEDLIDIGAHTKNHCSLRWMDADEQVLEIRESKDFLENILGDKVDLFSYPFGTKADFSEDTIEILKDEGYSKSVVGYPGEISINQDLFRIPRHTVRNYGLKEFKKFIENIQNKDGKAYRFSLTEKSAIEYAGPLSKDSLDCHEIIIWGSGDYANEVYKCICSRNLKDKVVAFADNDEKNVGKTIDGISIISAKDAMKYDAVFIIKNSYDWDICRQLIENGKRRIHWIIE